MTLTAAVFACHSDRRSVTFYDGTTILGTATITGGSAALTTRGLMASGFRSLTAHYGGRQRTSGQHVAGADTEGDRTAVERISGGSPVCSGHQPHPHCQSGISTVMESCQIWWWRIMAQNDGANNIDVLLGNGDGSFRAPVSYSAGTGPDFVAVGDFNGDGTPDLAVGDSGTNNVNILLGNGDGTFRSAVAYAIAGPASSIAIGDFNGDGKADLSRWPSGTASTFCSALATARSARRSIITGAVSRGRWSRETSTKTEKRISRW